MGNKFRFLTTILISGAVLLLVLGVVIIIVNVVTKRPASVAGIATSYTTYTSYNETFSRTPLNGQNIDYNFKIDN